MRTLWGESIDRDSENRDYLRVGETKAAVSVDHMVFPPLCPSCLMPNPTGVHAITVREGYRAGLLHPIYVPHCKRCPMRAGLFRGNISFWVGLAACVLFALGMLFFINPFWPRDSVLDPDTGKEVLEWRGRVVDWPAFVSWPYVPFFWTALGGIVLCGYFIHRKGIWVHTINEDSVIFAFKHGGYSDEFRRANRISGMRKTTEELADWEARMCPFCSRPLQRGQEICTFCGRKVPEGAVAARPTAAAQAAGMPAPEPSQTTVEAAARQTIEALSERAMRSGVKVEEWPKTIQCQCGRKYRIRHPGTYHCVDPQCGRSFIAEDTGPR